MSLLSTHINWLLYIRLYACNFATATEQAFVNCMRLLFQHGRYSISSESHCLLFFDIDFMCYMKWAFNCSLWTYLRWKIKITFLHSNFLSREKKNDQNECATKKSTLKIYTWLEYNVPDQYEKYGQMKLYSQSKQFSIIITDHLLRLNASTHAKPPKGSVQFQI